MALTYDLRPGASKEGLSFYLKKQGCLRKNRIIRELVAAGALPDAMAEAPAVGVLTHAFLEMYDAGQVECPENIRDVEFGPADHPVMLANEISEGFVLEEARRLGEWWTGRYTPNHFGRPLGHEVDLDAPGWLCEKLGVPRIGGRLDLVARLDEGDCARALVRYGLELTPGTYIIDHKTKGRATGYDAQLQALQAIWYPLLYDSVHPGARCEGMLFNFIIKTKNPSNVMMWRPPPTPEEVRALASTLSGTVAREAVNPDWANAALCFDTFTGKACFALTKGLCNRV